MPTFLSDDFQIADPNDITKILQFDVSTASAGAVTVASFPTAAGGTYTLAVQEAVNNFSQANFFTASPAALVLLPGASSGFISIASETNSGSDKTITFPNRTGTVSLDSLNETWFGQKIYDAATATTPLVISESPSGNNTFLQFYDVDNSFGMTFNIDSGGLSANRTVTFLDIGTDGTVGFYAAGSTNVATFESNTYTPTLTNVTNVAASTAFDAQYMRIGKIVTVSGKVTVDPTAAGATELGISLPIASNLANEEDCAGVAFSPGVAGQGAAVLADTTNDRAAMKWVAVDITSQTMAFTFTYQIL